MRSGIEHSRGNERKERIFSILKKFNKISAAVLIGAGLVFNSELLLTLGAIDVGQAWFWGKAEKWRKQSKGIGQTVLSGARA